MQRRAREPPPQLQLVLLIIVAASISIGCSALEGHDEVTTPPSAPPNSEMKCPCFPCGCEESPPPPPPPPPPKHRTYYCPPPPPFPRPYEERPPPPPVSYHYAEGPPARDLYPLDPYFHTSGAHRRYITLLPLYVMCGLLAMWESGLL